MQTSNGVKIDFVRGEMRLWSDYQEGIGAARGLVLHRLLTDAVPRVPRALVAGPHEARLIELVAERCAAVIVLLRSVDDATMLAKELTAPNISVVAGSLDGMEQPADGFGLVLASDGLDRLQGTDGADLDWPARLAALTALASPDGVVVLGLENEFSLSALVDPRLPADQHGDRDWVPLHDDPQRPVSAEQFAEALTVAGWPPSRVLASFPLGAEPLVLVDVDAAARTRPGRLAARLAVAALEADTVTPRLTPGRDSAEAAARAGLLGATAPGWLAVCNADTAELYAGTSPASTISTSFSAPANGAATEPGIGTRAAGGSWRVSSRLEPAAGVPAELSVAADAVPAEVPDTESVETVLLRLAAAEDVPEFRALASRLGDWVRERRPANLALWDDVVLDGDAFAPGISLWAPAGPASADEILAAAWQRFRDRLVRTHTRHPWPPWMFEEDPDCDVVSMWLQMSGGSASPAVLARGRELAGAVEAVTGAEQAPPDQRTVLAEADDARQRAVDLAGRVFALERAIGYRDKQLRTREDVIRSLRSELAEATKAKVQIAKIKASRTYKLANAVRLIASIRHPRRFAAGVRRRVRRTLANHKHAKAVRLILGIRHPRRFAAGVRRRVNQRRH
jgi:hypothetical protein